MPILIWQRMDLSLLSPLVNLAAIPLFSLLVVPGVLLGLLLDVLAGWPGDWLLQATAWLLDGFYRMLEWLARWKYRAITMSETAGPGQGLTGGCPDLVILDDLPGSAVERILPQADGDIPTIILSEAAAPDDASANRLGKPPKPAKLRALIRNLLEKSKARPV